MWFVVHTKPKKEKIVKINLEKEHLEVFLPLLYERKSLKRVSINPLFPGYLFVFTGWSGLAKVLWTSGVKKVLGYGDYPSPIEEEVVETLINKVDHLGIIYPDRRFCCGDRVKVIDGVFSGMIGTIENIKSARERIRILLSLFESGMRLEIDLELAEKIA